MPRKPRIYYPGALYHVLARGNAKQVIFLADADMLQYQSYVTEGLSEYGHRIHAYCWMNNHTHMLIQAGESSISKMMQQISQRYTQWFNRKYERVGHLFQGRYKALLVDADDYLLELVRYIHLNPKRAGVVDQLEDYQWSSHRAYLGNNVLPWLTTEWVLQQFGEDLSGARIKYRYFLEQKADKERLAQLSTGTAEGRILGSDRFILKVTAAQQTESTKQKLRCSLEEITEMVAKEGGVNAEEISSPSQRRAVSHARSMIALLAVDYAGLSATEVASHLSRDLTVISRQLKQTRERVYRRGAEKSRVERYLNLLNLQA